jgi:hypothetical protein
VFFQSKTPDPFELPVEELLEKITTAFSHQIRGWHMRNRLWVLLLFLGILWFGYMTLYSMWMVSSPLSDSPGWRFRYYLYLAASIAFASAASVWAIYRFFQWRRSFDVHEFPVNPHQNPKQS